MRGGRRAPVARGAGVPVSSSSRDPSCVTRAPRPTVGLQLRDHPSAGHRRVRVRHAAILRHRDGSLHCDGGFHLEGGLDRESGVSAGRVCPVCRGGGPPAAACRPGGSRHAPSPIRLARLVCGLPLRDHPPADHRRVRVRHAAILRHRDGSLHLDRYIRLESGVSAGRVCRGVDPPAARPSPRAESRAGGRWPPVCRWGGIGLLRHADGEAGGAPRPPLEQPLYSRFTAAPIMPYKSRYREGFARPDRPGRDGHQQPDGRSDEQSAR